MLARLRSLSALAIAAWATAASAQEAADQGSWSAPPTKAPDPTNVAVPKIVVGWHTYGIAITESLLLAAALAALVVLVAQRRQRWLTPLLVATACWSVAHAEWLVGLWIGPHFNPSPMLQWSSVIFLVLPNLGGYLALAWFSFTLLRRTYAGSDSPSPSASPPRAS